MLRRLRSSLPRAAYSLIRPSVSRILDPGRAIYNPYLSAKVLPIPNTGPHHIVFEADPATVTLAPDRLPLPPTGLMDAYGTSPETYLASGQKHMQTMLHLLRQAGGSPDAWSKILDFGCATGRMLRYYPLSASVTELWGVDYNVGYIIWCQQHFPPPFLFAITTTAPHLPFEDNYFDLVYAGSVFTHINHLSDAWFLELRRILRNGGYLYTTVNDESSIELIRTRYRGHATHLAELIEQLDRQTGFLSQQYASIAFGVEPAVQMFYSSGYLTRKWSRMLALCSRTPEAYGYQTALLWQK
jgi:ubiquinone/menaquinone biosynthesis C-methylase UbiE